MNITAIRNALAKLLSGLDVEVYAYAPDVPSVPSITIYPTSADYLVDYDGDGDITLAVKCMVAGSSPEDSQQQLDAWLGFGGTSSPIVDLIRGDETLGGAVSSAVVTGMQKYGVTTIGDNARYWSAELVLAIYA